MSKDSSERYIPSHNHLSRRHFTFKFQCKRQTAVIPSKLSFHIICVIAYISSLSDPTNSFIQSILLRIYQRLHPHIVQTVRFQQIDNIEAILHVFSRICYWKKVPLSVAIRIIISCQHQIIFKLWSLYFYYYFWMTLRRLPHSNRD